MELRDEDLRELAALIQAGISTPRERLKPQQIAAALARFDPSRPIWPRNRHEPRTLEPCPFCLAPAGICRNVTHGKRRYHCSACGKRWARRII